MKSDTARRHEEDWSFTATEFQRFCENYTHSSLSYQSRMTERQETDAEIPCLDSETV